MIKDCSIYEDLIMKNQSKQQRNKNGIGNKRGGNDRNEVLFWDVFSNMFLLNYILNIIHKVEWVVDGESDDYHNNGRSGIDEKRIKFKDIHSLKWMIENRQFELLKMKIINVNDEYIKFDMEEIYYFFYEYSELFQKIDNINTGKKQKSIRDIFYDDCHEEKELTIQEKEQTIEKAKQLINNMVEVFKLILSKRREEFEIIDLTKVAVKCNSIETLKLLSDNSCPIIIYPSTIEYAISNCHPTILNELLNNLYNHKNNLFNAITDKIKNTSLKLASNNKIYNNEMLEYLLNNPHLYQIPPQNQQDENINNSNIPKEKEDNYISFYTFLRDINNFQVKKKLLELDIIINVNDSFYGIDNWFDIDQSFEDLLILLQIHFKFTNKSSSEKGEPQESTLYEKINEINIKYGINCNDHEHAQLKLKELQKLLIIYFNQNSLYKKYINKYNECIDEYHNDGFHFTDLKNENQKKLLLLFRRLKINFNYSYGMEKKNNELNDIMERALNGKLEYYPLFDHIIASTNQNRFDLNITNQQVLDWLLNLNSQFVSDFIEIAVEYVSFSSIELFRIAFNNEKLKTLLHSVGKPSKLLSNSKCTQEYFKLSLGEFGVQEIIKSLHCYIANYRISNENLIVLVEFLNKYGYTGFSKGYFCEFLAELSGERARGRRVPSRSPCGGGSGLRRPINYIPNVIVNLYDVYPNENEMVNDLFDCITSASFKTAILFINNINIIKLDSSQFNILEFGDGRDYSDSTTFSNSNSYKLDQIKSILFLLIDKFKKRNMGGNKMVDGELESYQAIFNYYFKILISNKFVKFQNVIEIYHLLNDIGIEIQHSFFHSYYYISIRNDKFNNYLKTKSNIIGFPTFYSKKTRFENDNNNNKRIPMDSCFNIDEFTIDLVLGGSYNQFYDTYVFYQSFDQLLKKIVYQISILPSTLLQTNEKKKDLKTYLHYNINQDLIFFLKINRTDFFFSHLEFIENQLDLLKIDNHDQNESSDYDNCNNNYHEHFLKQTSTFNSASTLLLESSQIFKFSKPPTKFIIKSENWKSNLIIPCSTIVNSFNFSIYFFDKSNDVLGIAVKEMNVELLKSLIEFNYYVGNFIYDLFLRLIDMGRYEHCKFIMDNYDIHLKPKTYWEFKFLIENFPNRISISSIYDQESNSYFKKIEMEFLDSFIIYLSDKSNDRYYQKLIDKEIHNNEKSNLLDKLISNLYKNEEDNDNDTDEGENSNSSDNEDDYNKKEDSLKSIISNDIELQNLIKLSFDKYISVYKLNDVNEKENFIQNYKESYYSLFNTAFISGDIKFCNLIKSFYPNYFKITKESIKYAIKNNNIHIIKYYFNDENCNLLINNFNSDNQFLLNYLKNLLLNHSQYKYILIK